MLDVELLECRPLQGAFANPSSARECGQAGLLMPLAVREHLLEEADRLVGPAIVVRAGAEELVAPVSSLGGLDVVALDAQSDVSAQRAPNALERPVGNAGW